MALFHENIKQILAEVEKFLVETLKKETKLSKKTLEHKQQLLDKLTSFWEENPNMKIQANQDTSTGKDDDSTMTGGSSKSDESEETVYIDSGIAFVAAADLNSPLHSGFLEKKQKKGSGLLGPKFQRRWCVVKNKILYYYVKQDDKKQCGAFRLDGYKFRNAPDLSSKKKEKELCFELYQDDETRRVYQFMAKTKEVYNEWNKLMEDLVHPQIEEEEGDELYEDINAFAPEPTQERTYDVDVKTADTNKAADAAADEIYEDPGDEPPPPPPIPESKPPRTPTSKPPPTPTMPSDASTPPPPPPPVERIHKPGKPKVPEVVQDENQDEIYDEGFSPQDDTPAASTESSRELPPPPPPEAPGLPKRTRQLPAVPLPPTPTAPTPKKKINIKITCNPQEDFENRFYGKWDCTADENNELSFKKGDIIYILSKEFDDKAWWIGELNGALGLVPKAYLTPAFSLMV